MEKMGKKTSTPKENVDVLGTHGQSRRLPSPDISAIEQSKDSSRDDRRKLEDATQQSKLTGILRSTSYGGGPPRDIQRREGHEGDYGRGREDGYRERYRPPSRGSNSAYSDYYGYHPSQYYGSRTRPVRPRSTRSFRSTGHYDYEDFDEFDDSDFEYDRMSDIADPHYQGRGHYRNRHEQRDTWREWFGGWFCKKYGHYPTYEQDRAGKYYHLDKQHKGGHSELQRAREKKGSGDAKAAQSTEQRGEKGSDVDVSSTTSASSVGRTQKKAANADSMVGGVREPHKLGHFHSIASFGLGGNLVVLSRGELKYGGIPERGTLTRPTEVRRLRTLVTEERNVEILECMESFPGPLMRTTTHKGTWIQFCEKRASNRERNPLHRDPASAALIWQLLALPLRQNCPVMGSDLAQLLAKSGGGLLPSPDQGPETSESGEPLEDYEHGNQYKFDRAFVNMGSQCDSLANDLWGHALFLATNTDQRTHSQVMVRFANSLSLNDPLQTLYQLLSGRPPFAVTKIPDENWGSCKPYLAMILANFNAADPVHTQSVLAMGNTLLQGGFPFACKISVVDPELFRPAKQAFDRGYYIAIRAKFEQNPILQTILLSTGDALLVKTDCPENPDYSAGAAVSELQRLVFQQRIRTEDIVRNFIDPSTRPPECEHWGLNKTGMLLMDLRQAIRQNFPGQLPEPFTRIPRAVSETQIATEQITCSSPNSLLGPQFLCSFRVRHNVYLTIEHYMCVTGLRFLRFPKSAETLTLSEPVDQCVINFLKLSQPPPVTRLWDWHRSERFEAIKSAYRHMFEQAIPALKALLTTRNQLMVHCKPFANVEDVELSIGIDEAHFGEFTSERNFVATDIMKRSVHRKSRPSLIGGNRMDLLLMEPGRIRKNPYAHRHSSLVRLAGREAKMEALQGVIADKLGSMNKETPPSARRSGDRLQDSPSRPQAIAQVHRNTVNHSVVGPEEDATHSSPNLQHLATPSRRVSMPHPLLNAQQFAPPVRTPCITEESERYSTHPVNTLEAFMKSATQDTHTTTPQQERSEYPPVPSTSCVMGQ